MRWQLDTEAYFTQFDYHSDGAEADLVAVCISEYMGRPVAHLHCSASVSKDTRHAMVLFSEVINGLSDKAIRRFYERLGRIEGVNKHSKVVIMIALVETLKEEGGKILDIQAVIGNGNESHNYLVLTVTLSSGAVLLFRIQVLHLVFEWCALLPFSLGPPGDCFVMCLVCRSALCQYSGAYRDHMWLMPCTHISV